MLLIHDVYPEVLVAAGVSDPDSMLVRGLNWLSQRLYRSMDRIVVLGRDMETLALNKLETDLDRVVIIPNWADIDQIYPADRAENELLRETNLQDKFVIQYAGNMGRTHNLEGVVAAAQRLQTEQPNVHFLFIGSGAKRQWLEDTITAQRVDNIILLSPRPRSDQHNFLNACDATIISFVPGMAGISVPSRMYNIMASGKPIFAIADDHSELAQVVREEDIGWVIPPSQPEKLVAAIAEAQGDPTRLADMGRRARLAVEHKYTLPHIIAAYERMIREMD